MRNKGQRIQEPNKRKIRPYSKETEKTLTVNTSKKRPFERREEKGEEIQIGGNLIGSIIERNAACKKKKLQRPTEGQWTQNGIRNHRGKTKNVLTFPGGVEKVERTVVDRQTAELVPQEAFEKTVQMRKGPP